MSLMEIICCAIMVEILPKNILTSFLLSFHSDLDYLEFKGNPAARDPYIKFKYIARVRVL